MKEKEAGTTLRLSLLLGVLAFAGRAAATTLPSLPIQDLLEAADVAAVVEITRGELVTANGGGCGARYVGRVLERIKGLEASVSEVAFGPYGGRKLGGKYLVLLTRRARRYDPLTSTNSMDAGLRASWETRCAESLPEYREMHSGMATLEVDWTTKFDKSDAVKFEPKYVKWPNGLVAKLSEPGDNAVFAAAYWVRLDEVLKSLREYRGKAAKPPSR